MKPRSLSPSSFFFPWAARQRRLATSRPALSQEEFVTHIEERGGDPEAASLIWTHLHEWGLEKGFTLPLPTTELLKEFGDVGTPLKVARLVSEMRRGAGRAQEG